ncbi:MAG: RDD family protein [Nitrososphaerota archaeon]|nr:RDD family protein [Nitrososphaerota archaeon]
MFCAKCGKELPDGAVFCPSCGSPVHAGVGDAHVSGIDALTRDHDAQEYWVERLIALVVDYVIVYVVLGIVTAIVAIPALLTGGTVFFGVVFGGVALLWGIIFVLYNTVMEASSGASIGKRLFRLKSVSRRGSNPTFAEAFVRNLSKIYWLLLLLDVIVGLAVSHGYQQKYSDHYLGTKVVRG